MVLEKLAAMDKDSASIAEVAKLVQAVRSDLATATDAVLSFIARADHPREEIAAWVRNNLNR
jgi:hypothetical protein